MVSHHDIFTHTCVLVIFDNSCTHERSCVGLYGRWTLGAERCHSF